MAMFEFLYTVHMGANIFMISLTQPINSAKMFPLSQEMIGLTQRKI